MISGWRVLLFVTVVSHLNRIVSYKIYIFIFKKKKEYDKNKKIIIFIFLIF